ADPSRRYRRRRRDSRPRRLLVRDELIPLSWDCNDVAMIAGCLAESATKRKHVVSRVDALNVTVAPAASQKLIARHNTSGMLDKRQEDIERLRRQGNAIVAVEQQPPCDIHTKRSKSVADRRGGHGGRYRSD